MKKKLTVVLTFSLVLLATASLKIVMAETTKISEGVGDTGSSVILSGTSSEILSDLRADSYDLKEVVEEDRQVATYNTKKIKFKYGTEKSSAKESTSGKVSETDSRKTASKKQNSAQTESKKGDSKKGDSKKGDSKKGDSGSSSSSKSTRTDGYSDYEYSYSKLAKKVMTEALKGNKEFSQTSKKRQEIILYAMQYIGNKYVYGGTDVEDGIDCSAFTRYVMKHFGISLPRTSGEQRSSGKKVSKPEPGDLICYSGHVVIYVGDGKIVHASNSKPYPSGGIKVSDDYHYRVVKAIRNVVGD